MILVRNLVVSSLLAPFAMSTLAHADSPPAAVPLSRFDVALELPIWPSLTDLQPAAGGAYDPIGAGLGGSFHVPIRWSEHGELLVGVDGFIAATASNIPGPIEDLLARHLYIGGSVKWLFGERRNLSLDAGAGYHELDMAEVRYDFWGQYEAEHWNRSRAGAYLGMTWDAGAGRPDHSGGLSIGIRAHFVDFGRVRDENSFYPSLGDNAGRLEGPLYMLRIAYSGR